MQYVGNWAQAQVSNAFDHVKIFCFRPPENNFTRNIEEMDNLMPILIFQPVVYIDNLYHTCPKTDL
jgi:hypothetical protein